jgi:hypothetical protein
MPVTSVGASPGMKKPVKATSGTMERRDSQKNISLFHTLSKKLETADSTSEREEIQREIDGLGGLDAYQKASMKGVSRLINLHRRC